MTGGVRNSIRGEPSLRAGPSAPARRPAAPLSEFLLLATVLVLAGPAVASPATRLLGPGADLQAALDAARPGDVILLQAGTTFTGNFVLPAWPPQPGEVVVRSSAGDGPGTGRRVTPDDVRALARIASPNDQPALRTAPGAHHWRLLLLEISAGRDGVGDIVRVGDGSGAQRQLQDVPHHLVLDRCYVHGEPGTRQKRGIALNSGDTSILNCWIDDIKQSGQDSQAIAGWNGPGPYVIANNYLSAAGQAFMMGGADPAIPGLVPAGIRFTGNYLTRRLEWRQSGWQVKNLLELKNARDVTIEGNVLERNWLGAQSGYAVLITPRNQDGGAPWATVEHVVFRFNVVRHSSAAISILGHDDTNPSGPASGIEISQNLFYDIDGAGWGGGGNFLLLGGGPSNVVVEHNTILHSGNVISAYGGTAQSPETSRGFVFRDNLARHNAYGVHGSDHGVGNDTLAAYFPSAIFTGNVLAGGSPSAYPGGNAFPSVGEFERWFVDEAGGDFQLKATAPAAARNAGADMARVQEAWKASQAGMTATPHELPVRVKPGRGKE